MNPRTGLSLFELLVSLALLALLSAGLAAALNIGAQLYSRTTTLGVADEQVVLRGRLRGWLASAVPPAQLVPFPSRFIGTAEGLEFTTLAETPFAPDASGLRVSLAFDGGELRMAVRTMSDDGSTLAEFDHLLTSDTGAGSISYFDASSDPPEWRGSWQETTRLPDLVQITTDPTSRPDWPEFTVRPILR